mgnify:CR=1 FL=1
MAEFDYAPESIKEEWNDLFSQMSEASTKVSKDKWKHFTPQFVDTNTPSVDEISQALNASEERRKLYKEQCIFQMEGKAVIDTTMPITLFPIADIHFGSVYSNVELWEKHRKAISETPGAYVVFLHNLVDNDIKFKNANMPNGIPPHEQFRVMQKWIKDLDQEGKVLGAIWSDCHDGWSMAQAGIEAEKLLFGYEGRKFPVIENGGILNLEVDEQKYSIGLWHKQGPFNSRFNPEHALRQNRRLNHEGATDVEIGAHYHNTAASANYEGAKNRMKPVHFIRVGTYKGVPTSLNEQEYITDRWAVEKFGSSGEMPGTALMFFNKEHRIDNSLDFETAMEKHMAIRTLALVREMGLSDKLSKLMK